MKETGRFLLSSVTVAVVEGKREPRLPNPYSSVCKTTEQFKPHSPPTFTSAVSQTKQRKENVMSMTTATQRLQTESSSGLSPPLHAQGTKSFLQ